jgi:VWFA-related protein
VRVVLLDVVVTDGDGNPITGLKESGFRIFEDKKPQNIASFKEHQGAPVIVSDLPPMPKDVYTNYPVTSTADSIDVILMDSLNTPILDQDYAHQQVLKYLRTVPAGARVAIFTLSSRLRMIQEFTTDSTRLQTALNDPSLGTPRSSPLLQSPAERQADSAFINHVSVNQMGTPAVGNLALEAVDPVNSLNAMLAERDAQLTQHRVEITLNAFQQLARYLSGYPGRKNVMWVSGGFPLIIFPQADSLAPSVAPSNFTDALEKTADLCTAAQMAIYPVSAEGLVGDPRYMANASAISQTRAGMVIGNGTEQMVNFLRNDFLRNHMMDSLAKDTGGQAFYNTNGLKQVLTKVTNEGMHYYTLTYSPTNNKMDGRYRHTSVEMPNQKYKLSYRRGYYATNTSIGSGQPNTHLPLLPFMSFGLPDMAQLVYKLSITPSTNQPKPNQALTDFKGPSVHYALDIAVSLYQLNLKLLPDGNRRAQLEVRVVAYDDAGKPLAMTGEEGAVNLTPKAFEESKNAGIRLHEEIDVPANSNIHLRTGVYDLSSGRAGTLGLRIRTEKTAEIKLRDP